MAGHSKWSKIKRQKGATDAKRGAVLAKMSKAIMVAVKTGGGGDPDTNYKLKAAIDKAKQEGVPKNNIERAIEKASGAGSDAEELKEVTYEGYLAGGVAVMVFCATDNTNRTYSDVRTIFGKAGASLGSPGCCAYMFNKTDEGYEPLSTIEITDTKDAQTIIKVMEALDDNEDVIDVVSNFEINDSLVADLDL